VPTDSRWNILAGRYTGYLIAYDTGKGFMHLLDKSDVPVWNIMIAPNSGTA